MSSVLPSRAKSDHDTSSRCTIGERSIVVLRWLAFRLDCRTCCRDNRSRHPSPIGSGYALEPSRRLQELVIWGPSFRVEGRQIGDHGLDLLIFPEGRRLTSWCPSPPLAGRGGRSLGSPHPTLCPDRTQQAPWNTSGSEGFRAFGRTGRLDGAMTSFLRRGADDVTAFALDEHFLTSGNEIVLRCHWSAAGKEG